MKSFSSIASIALFALVAVASHATVAEDSPAHESRKSLTSQQAAQRSYGGLHSSSTLPLKQAGGPDFGANPGSLASQQGAEKAYGSLRSNSLLPLKRARRYIIANGLPILEASEPLFRAPVIDRIAALSRRISKPLAQVDEQAARA